MINNFDMSSSGVNIELDIFYDRDMSQIYFDDLIYGCYHQTIIFRSNRGELDYIVFFEDPDNLINKYNNRTIREHYTDIYNNMEWHDIPYDYISRGYNQGDAIKIIYHDIDEDERINHETIDNIIWDSPISVIIEIDGVELYDIEYDEYNYNPDEIIKSIINHPEIINRDDRDYINTWLIDNMPENLEYR